MNQLFNGNDFGDMEKWFRAAQYKKVYRFLGQKVVSLIAAGIAIGVALFIVEMAFAYAIQSFLVAIGAMAQSTIRLPSWIPQMSFSGVLVFVLVVGVLRGLLQAGQIYFQGLVVESFTYLQRLRIIRWAFHSESVSTSEVMSLAYEQTEAGSAVSMNVMSIATQLTAGFLLFISLVKMAPALTLVACFLLLAVGLPLRQTNRKIKIAGARISGEWNRTNSLIIMSIKNLLLMQIYGTQAQEEAKVGVSLNSFYRFASSYQFLSALKFAVPQIFGVLVICLLSLAGKSKLEMEPGILISYFYLFVRFIQTYASISYSYSYMSRFWERALALSKWWADHSFDGFRNLREISKHSEQGLPLDGPIGWSIKKLFYRYKGAEQEAVSGLSMNVRPGQVLVITGPSGSGKSTVLSLMLGLVKPASGDVNVLIGDESIPVADSKQRLLRDIGYVGPESFIVEGTIRQNLVYGLVSTPSDDFLYEALSTAECNFVKDLPKGLDHWLTEQGGGLSAGQKQRLSLARALLRKPRALILDEATSNLDMETEEKLIGTLAKLKGHMTIISVTHRPAFLNIADQHIRLREQ